MGLFKFLKESIEDAQQQIKDSIMDKLEDAQQQFKDNIDGAKKQMLGRTGEFFGQQSEMAVNRLVDPEQEDHSSSRQIGNYDNGVLEVFDGVIAIDSDNLEDYKNLRKIIFPVSLVKVDTLPELEQLEDLDFSKVSRLEEIPEWFIDGNHSIHSFIIPNGVKKVGKCFFGDPKPGSEVYVPASVEEMRCISGSGNNDLLVFLFAPDLDISDLHEDVNVLYVLPQYYSVYSKKLIELESEARLCEMPADKINFYNNTIKESPIEEKNSEPEEPVAMEKKEDVNIEINQKVGGMFSDRIENLISAALQDGVLTEKEEEILKRRVEKEGEDWDEVEMYIQSLLQKRQQELDKEMKSNQEIQEKSDMNYEQKRAETLRICPKCGAYIPHLSNVCPDCGFIIEKNDTDKIISTLIALLRSCIEAMYVNIKSDVSFEEKTTKGIIIKKEMYEELPNCYLLCSDQSGTTPSTVRVDYNYSGILTEAHMYSANDTINSMLFKLHRKEKDLILKKLWHWKKRCDESKGKDKMYLDVLRQHFDKLKDYDDIIDDAEFARIEDSIRQYL